MRITPTIQNRNFLENINDTKTRLDKYQREVSSGKRVNQPSDDPFAASQASRIASVTSANDQYISNNDLLRNKLELTDSSLQAMNQSIDSAKSLAAQALSGTTTADSRVALATAVDGVINDVLSTAGTQFDGTYLFSGTQTNTEPFKQTGTTITFQGNSEASYSRLDRSTVIKTNITNQDLFAGPPAIFDVLQSLKSAIASNDTTALNASMKDLDTISSRISSNDAVVGNNIQLVDQVQSALKSHNEALRTETSSLTDADLSQSISSLDLASQSVNITLQAEARVQQLSLLDYLG
jgi:flagellar hook-associated protein 3 FlgL